MERGGRKVGEANGNKRLRDGNREGRRVRVLKRTKWLRIKYKQRKHNMGWEAMEPFKCQHS